MFRNLGEKTSERPSNLALNWSVSTPCYMFEAANDSSSLFFTRFPTLILIQKVFFQVLFNPFSCSFQAQMEPKSAKLKADPLLICWVSLKPCHLHSLRMIEGALDLTRTEFPLVVPGFCFFFLFFSLFCPLQSLRVLVLENLVYQS